MHTPLGLLLQEQEFQVVTQVAAVVAVQPLEPLALEVEAQVLLTQTVALALQTLVVVAEVQDLLLILATEIVDLVVQA
jgi:hypothetical protein